MENNIKPSKLYPLGLVVLILSFVWYLYANRLQDGHRNLDFSASFWVCYVTTICYTILILAENGIRWARLKNSDNRLWTIALSLFTISAFALNKTVTVFAPFPAWLNLYTLSLVFTSLLFPYRHKMHEKLQYIFAFLCGGNIALALYLTIFIGPLHIYGFLLFFALGVPLHALVPMLWLINYIVIWLKVNDLTHIRKFLWIGIMLPFAILGIFLYKWNQVQTTLKASQKEYVEKMDNSLPQWVFLAQRLPDDMLTEMILMSPAKAQPIFWLDGHFGLLSQFGHDFKMEHNPLSTTAEAFYGKLDIPAEDIFKILETKYDARHQTSRRLWRGDDLMTKKVKTEVQMFPSFRLAHIDKTITVHNDPFLSENDNTWIDNTQQEAVYTFHLPQGAVVSGLSLWVDGVERASRLTTKHKADSAYVNIVGVQRRDPCLLHWQEGNRVTVTVFPCTPKENRVFRMGITAPLVLKKDKLVLENLWFEGPTTEKAAEEIMVSFGKGEKGELDAPWAFHKKDAQTFDYQGLFKPYWEISVTKQPLSNSSFTFGNNRYHLEQLDLKTEEFSPEEIILDINRNWSAADLLLVKEIIGKRKTFVFLPEKTLLTMENISEIYFKMLKYRFSLLPIYQIEDRDKTLIISKSSHQSPLLEDIKESEFAQKSANFYAQSSPIRFYNLSENELSPYWQSLKQLRIIHYASGNFATLSNYLAKNQFPMDYEAGNRVSLPESQMCIVKDSSSAEDTPNITKASNFVMRLYAYNDLLKSIGRKYFEKDSFEDAWVRKAEEAYVVSPISSLIVLETEDDYNKMGIKENKNTIGNSLLPSNAGAVPEPHEWALILITLGIIGWELKKRGKISI